MSSNVTRRDFIRLATGFLAYLPRIAGVPGAFLLATAPTAVQARELDLSEGEYDPAHVVLIDPDELGFQVLDVVSGLAIPDAHVVVTSYAEGARVQTVDGYTDASGVWVSNVVDLCEPDGLARPIKSYEFYARIDISKDGYRPFTTALVRAVAGQGVAVSTQPIDPGNPYPRLAALNEYDILYTANEFIRSPANDAPCVLELLVENFNGASSVTAQLYQNETPLGIGGSFAAEQGSVHVRLEGAYLNSSYSPTLPAGGDFSLRLTYSTGFASNTEMIVPFNLVVMDPPEGVTAPILSDTKDSGEKRTFAPFNRWISEDSGLSFPKEWPVIGNQKLKIWTPECWLGIAVDPFGFIRISAKTPPLGMLNKYGKPEERAWGLHPREDMRTQIDKYKETIESQRGKEKEFMGDWDPFWQEGLKPEALTRDQPTKKLAVTVIGELAAIMQWKTDGYFPIYDAKDIEGIVLLHVLGVVDYVYKQQFVAACIPMVFTFNVRGSVDFGMSADITSPTFDDLIRDQYDLDFQKTGVTLTFYVLVALSLGAGVDGLLTLSLKGMLTFTFFFGVTKREDPSLPRVHFTFSMGFVAKVVLQYLCFTQEWTPLPDLQEKLSDKEPLYDNWRKDLFANFPQYGDEQKSMYDFIVEGASIVDNDTLAARGEYAVAEASDVGSILREHLNGLLQSTDKTFTTDDGTPYTMSVYTPVSQDRFEALKAAILYALEQTEGDEATISALLASATAHGLLGDVEDPYQGSFDVIPVFGSTGSSIDDEAVLTSFDGRYNFDRPWVGVGSLGLYEGVRPTSDIPISQDVFSDPRTKLVSVFGRPCMVRIATIELSTGDARTRLVLQEIPSDGTMGAPLLLDFKLSVGRYPRYEYFDYNFDVVQSTTFDEVGNERCDLHLLVISGKRDDDDETTLVSAAQGHIFSYVRYSFTDAGDLSQRYASAMQVTPDKIHATDCPDDWDSHLYLSPQIKLVEQNGQKACVMSFVDRAGSEEAGVLNDQSGDETRVGIGMFFAKVVDGGRKEDAPVLSVPDLSGLRDKLGTMGDLALTSMNMMGVASGYNTIKFAGDTTHYLLLSVSPDFSVTVASGDEFFEESVAGISQLVRVSDDAIADVLTDPEETQFDLHEVLGQDYFLASVNNRLNRVTWGNVEAGYPVPVLEECGPEGVRVHGFAVDPTGEFIYWPTVNEGDGPAIYDSDGNLLPTTEMRAYRIMACRMRSGRFSKPFLLAEGDAHTFDTLRVLENNFEGISFVSTEVVDAFQAQANIWFTVVPHLRCLTVAYFTATSAIVHEGDELSFRIALRNDGNTYLKQATIRLASSLDEGAQVFAEQTLVFSAENTLVSQWNPQDEDGNPSGVEPDFALAPGATSLYLMPGFVVPKGAPHDLYIYASVVDGSLAMADVDGIVGQAEGDTLEFLGTGFKTIATGERVVAGQTLTFVKGGSEVPIDISSQHPSNVVFRNIRGADEGGSSGGGANGGGTSAGGGTGSAGGKGGSRTRQALLPKTGDESSALRAGAAALGTTGAAMIAYSYRREKLEREVEE